MYCYRNVITAIYLSTLYQFYGNTLEHKTQLPSHPTNLLKLQMNPIYEVSRVPVYGLARDDSDHQVSFASVVGGFASVDMLINF